MRRSIKHGRRLYTTTRRYPLYIIRIRHRQASVIKAPNPPYIMFILDRRYTMIMDLGRLCIILVLDRRCTITLRSRLGRGPLWRYRVYRTCPHTHGLSMRIHPPTRHVLLSTENSRTNLMHFV